MYFIGLPPGHEVIKLIRSYTKSNFRSILIQFEVVFNLFLRQFLRQFMRREREKTVFLRLRVQRQMMDLRWRHGFSNTIF